MNWLPALAVIGGLLTALAAVEWALSRLEEAPQRRPRALSFLAAGLACLVAFAAFSLPALWRPAVAKTDTAGVPLTAFEGTQTEILALVEQITRAEQPPTLAEVLQNRRRLMDARLTLARGEDPNSPLRPLVNQSDAMLGVAYHALGAQWLLVKQGNWEKRELREAVTRQLAGEVQHWQEIRDCLRSGQKSCSSAPELNDRQRELRDFNLWFHPYALELIRFNEEDPDLVDRSPSELTRLRDLMVRAFRELPSQQVGPQGQAVLNAAASVIKVAQQSLLEEDSAIARGTWSPQLQKVIYEPVQRVMEQYSRTLLCSSQVTGTACGPSSGVR